VCMQNLRRCLWNDAKREQEKVTSQCSGPSNMGKWTCVSHGLVQLDSHGDRWSVCKPIVGCKAKIEQGGPYCFGPDHRDFFNGNSKTTMTQRAETGALTSFFASVTLHNIKLPCKPSFQPSLMFAPISHKKLQILTLSSKRDQKGPKWCKWSALTTRQLYY
jgi:hypothetical protein